MKKITALALALLMVVSMIPAMALMSSAAEEFTSGTYGSGAETWRQKGDDSHFYYHTQFLLYVPKTLWYGADGLAEGDDGINAKVGYSGTKFNAETGEWTVGGITNGKFVLNITDLSGETKDVVCPPTTVGTIGDNMILRFETADYGTPAYQIQSGNSYKIRLSIYLDANASAPDYVGSEVPNISWTAGKADEGTDKMYSKNVALAEIPKYTGEVPDPYETPVEVTWVTYNNLWFENHTSWGRVFMVGFDKTMIPDGGNTGANTIINTAKIVITYEDGTKKVVESFAPGNESFTMDPNILFRVPYDPFPAPGAHENVKIEFVRKSDDKVMYTGTTSINNPMYEDPDLSGDFPVKSTLASYTGGTSDWVMHNGQKVLAVTMDGILNEMDVHSNTVSWEVLFDGKAVTNAVESIADLGAQDNGTFKTVLYLNVGEPTDGSHTVKVTVKYDSDVLYDTDALTVNYSAGAKGDYNGDGKVNGSDRNYLARALASWKDYEVPAAAAGDFNGDGKVNGSDRNYLARALASWKGYSL